MQFIVNQISELEAPAKYLIEQLKFPKVAVFKGELGAGKTTFIQLLCKMLGYNGKVTSPTFGLVHEYDLELNNKIFHFDCYRLNSSDEAIGIGFLDYLDSDQICFIEWPEIIADLLPSLYLHVQIVCDLINPEIRIIDIQIMESQPTYQR